MTKNEFIETYYREKYEERLKFARKRVGDYNLALAEEALQEAFYKALKYFRAYRKEEDFENWFGRILINCINDIKRIERERGMDQKGARYHHDDDYITVIPFTKEVIEQLGKENIRNQEILNMYFFYQYKSREIAEFLNISHDVVRDVIRTFRKRVKRV